MTTTKINRSPVLTQWAAVVARHLGHDEATALTLGRTLAGLSAQSKARRLGLYQSEEEDAAPPKKQRRLRRAAIPLMRRQIPALNMPQGIRAAANDQAVDPESVRRYPVDKFGEHLPAVPRAMEELAPSLNAETLAERSYALYEQSRPDVPRIARGWTSPGELDLHRLYRLARDDKGERL